MITQDHDTGIDQPKSRAHFADEQLSGRSQNLAQALGFGFVVTGDDDSTAGRDALQLAA